MSHRHTHEEKGRVTNSTVQNPRALVEYMIQFWSQNCRVTYRALGRETIQFGFESERDLQAVLRRGPFHFK
ncbi:hypothetical protein V5N11_007078 [Cardamine amara subsp. amara]|uniref:DUF4283 domain-containing protein n=1 Tax=Cardamine amara subsp. amara TaxID=228776 RepID=A0ABD1AL51_CARAN